MKTIIIGNSGSGKTWLARCLASKSETPIVHLDDLFWEPGGFEKKRSPEQVDRMIEANKRTASWIVEGVFGELAERYYTHAKLLIWLDIEWEILQNPPSRARLREQAPPRTRAISGRLEKTCRLGVAVLRSR